MGMGMGWYGPLIDLSAASSHVGDLVQLLVFVHRSAPLEYKFGRGGEVVRTDIDVGDETRSYFCISIWNKHLSSSAQPARILLFRNVKLIQFRSMVEARTVEYSSILTLIHPHSSFLSRGVDDLVSSCPLLGSAKDKLRRVIQWVHQTTPSLSNQFLFHQIPASHNWKVQEEQKPREFFLLSDVLLLSSPCKATFRASISEVFLQSLLCDEEKERLFISRRLTTKGDTVVEDMVCIGCQLCGIPLCSDSTGVGNYCPLYCDKSSDRCHTVGTIYMPFMLYVWDNSKYIPLYVKNKAAELLFGNIVAENVYQSYKSHKDHQNLKNPFKAHVNKHDHYHSRIVTKGVGSSSSVSAVGFEMENLDANKSPNLYLIWLIVLKMLLQGENSSLKFTTLVDPSLEIEDGRFEMISVSIS